MLMVPDLIKLAYRILCYHFFYGTMLSLSLSQCLLLFPMVWKLLDVHRHGILEN